MVGVGQVGDELCGGFVAAVAAVQDEVALAGVGPSEGGVVVGGVGAGVEEVCDVAGEFGVG